MITGTMFLALSCTFAAAAADMQIRVGSETAAPNKIVPRAMRVIVAIFDPLHITVDWRACEDGTPVKELLSALLVTIRVRSDSPEHTPRGDATNLMGRAFTSDIAGELQADTYYRAIEELAQRNQNDPAEA